MGVQSSANVSSAFKKIKTWPWARVIAAIEAYFSNEYDFIIDKSVVMSLTGFDAVEATELISSLPTDNIGNVNAITLLVAIISIGDSGKSSLRERISALFDVFDFEGKRQIHIDEVTILFLTFWCATQAILGRKNESPPTPIISKITLKAFEQTGKKTSTHIMKEELVEWVDTRLSTLPATDIETVVAYINEGGGATDSDSRLKSVATMREKVAKQKSTRSLSPLKPSTPGSLSDENAYLNEEFNE